MNMLSDFEVGMKFEKIPQVYSFWKWGAVIFAIFATFSSIIRRIKLIFIHFHTVKPSLHQIEEIFEYSDDDDISLASSDDEQDERENVQTTSFGGQHRVDEDFCVKGSCLSFKSQLQNGLKQRRRRSSGGAWSEFSYGKNVVKLWDSLGLSLDFDEDLFNYESKSVVSTWESREDKKSSDFFGDVWNVSAAAPPMTSSTMVLTAEGNGKGDRVILSGYDTRMRRRVPALYAEWSLPAEKVAVTGASSGGVGKVYVRDDVSGVLTVGDVRNVRRPLESGRESDGETWWDADAVIVEDEFNEFRD